MNGTYATNSPIRASYLDPGFTGYGRGLGTPTRSVLAVGG